MTYTPREWSRYDMTGSSIEVIPVSEVKPVADVFICGVDSDVADRHRNAGTEELLFYYDLEQVSAGLDKVYGLMSLDALSEEWTAPNGRIYQPGALVMVVTALNRTADGEMTFSVLISD